MRKSTALRRMHSHGVKWINFNVTVFEGLKHVLSKTFISFSVQPTIAKKAVFVFKSLLSMLSCNFTVLGWD
tara:strand:- start:26 stop:238 length:213 start_codon:yes stop_codon:yes gene_type:complete